MTLDMSLKIVIGTINVKNAMQNKKIWPVRPNG